MSEADHTLSRFRVSYTFTDIITGDADAIRKEIRNLSFSTAFDPNDLNCWRCEPEMQEVEDREAFDGKATRPTGRFVFRAQRTLTDEIAESSERAALRKFLYAVDLPDTIDLAAIRIERLDAPTTAQVVPLHASGAAA